MPLSGDAIRTAGSLVTIGTALAGLTWFVASLHGRVERLEEQVRTLTVAPVIAGPAGQGAIPNPVAQACADLARQAADLAPKGELIAKGEIEQLMRGLVDRI